jgi:hypothetical protein
MQRDGKPGNWTLPSEVLTNLLEQRSDILRPRLRSLGPRADEKQVRSGGSVHRSKSAQPSPSRRGLEAM